MPVYSLAAGCRKWSRKKDGNWISSPDAQLWVVVVFVAIVALFLVRIVSQPVNQSVKQSIPESAVQAEPQAEMGGGSENKE